MTGDLILFSLMTLLGIGLFAVRERQSNFWRRHWPMPSRLRDSDEPAFYATWGPLLMAGFGLLAVIDILIGHTK